MENKVKKMVRWMSKKSHIAAFCAMLCVWGAAAWSGCDTQPKPANSEEAAYFQQIMRFREQKDEHFRTSKNSPLLKGDQESFEGLRYFRINPAVRFEVPFHKYPSPDTVYLMTTGGKDRPALRYGYFDFEAQQQQNRLHVYKFLDHENSADQHLFLPFLDQSSGEQSYGGGRYLDLRESKSDSYTVDFNLAYNPSCAYGRKDYICPVPPSENTLSIAILAGEKAWH